MPLIAKYAGNTDKSYTPHPEGQFVATCVDAIDLGERVEQFENNPKRLVPKMALVFRTGEVNENGDEIYPALELTLSMGEKATLRRHLEAWRGKPYTPAQVAEGIDIEKLVGQPAMLTITQQQSKQGRTYAKVMGIAAVHPKLRDEAPGMGDYQRPKYWEERINDYLAEAQAFRAEQGRKAAPAPKVESDPLTTDALADSLPF